MTRDERTKTKLLIEEVKSKTINDTDSKKLDLQGAWPTLGSANTKSQASSSRLSNTSKPSMTSFMNSINCGN